MTAAIWEIVNMSDPYTILCDDHEVAALACLMLGEGHYAFREVQGGREVPIFLFGGAQEWFTEQFKRSLSDSLKSNALALADALDSVMIGRPSERQAYELALAHIPTPEGRATYRAAVLDEQRSSLNNIGQRAWNLAARLRKAQDGAA